MQENLYQNVDSLQNNPLDNSPSPTPVTPLGKKIPLDDPKIVILLVLGTITVILLITSLIINIIRQKNQKIIPVPTPTPSEIPLPTTSNSLIPDIYQDKFKKLEDSFNYDLDLEVPAIDIETGL